MSKLKLGRDFQGYAFKNKLTGKISQREDNFFPTKLEAEDDLFFKVKTKRYEVVKVKLVEVK